MLVLDQRAKDWLRERLGDLEAHFAADVIFCYGISAPSHDKPFRDFIEKLAAEKAHKRLVMFLNTAGGSAETVEKMVRIMRYHYHEVYFVVPDFPAPAGAFLLPTLDHFA